MKDFQAEVINLLQERNPERIFEETTVLKNNDTVKNGIICKLKNVNYAPTIYIDDLYELYTNNEIDMKRVVEETESRMNDSDLPFEFDVNRLREFSDVKGNICYKLVNKSRNQDRLKEKVYSDYLDLAIMFEIRINDDLSIDVTNELIQIWDVSIEELMSVAAKNTKKLVQPQVLPLDTVIRNMGRPVPEDFTSPLLMITNENRLLGATVIMYEGLLKSIAEYMNEKKLYILPSSIHECLLLPYSVLENPEDISYLSDLVHSVNKYEVVPEEYLSDSIYAYSLSTDSIEVVENIDSSAA